MQQQLSGRTCFDDPGKQAGGATLANLSLGRPEGESTRMEEGQVSLGDSMAQCYRNEWKACREATEVGFAGQSPHWALFTKVNMVCPTLLVLTP